MMLEFHFHKEIFMFTININLGLMQGEARASLFLSRREILSREPATNLSVIVNLQIVSYKSIDSILLLDML